MHDVTIPAGLWEDERFAQLPVHGKLLYIALLSYIDEECYGRDDYKLITAKVFWSASDMDGAREWVSEMLNRLEEEKIINRGQIDDYGRDAFYMLTDLGRNEDGN